MTSSTNTLTPTVGREARTGTTRDRRVVRTEGLIRQAFLAGMAEVGLRALTVSDIVARADINRSTFYDHFADKYEVLEAIEDDLLANWRALADTFGRLLTSPRPPQESSSTVVTTQLAQFLATNGTTLTSLIAIGGDPGFLSRFAAEVQSFQQQWHFDEHLRIPQRYAIAAMIGMVTHILEQWVVDGFQETPSELVDVVFPLMQVMIPILTGSSDLSA